MRDASRTMPTTAHVLQQAKSGDEDAFTQLVTPYRRELHVHCYRMLGSFDDAEDALQDTLLAAWRGIGGSGPRRRSGPGSIASRPTPASTTAGRPAVARRPLRRLRRRPHHLPTARSPCPAAAVPGRASRRPAGAVARPGVPHRDPGVRLTGLHRGGAGVEPTRPRSRGAARCHGVQRSRGRRDVGNVVGRCCHPAEPGPDDIAVAAPFGPGPRAATDPGRDRAGPPGLLTPWGPPGDVEGDRRRSVSGQRQRAGRRTVRLIVWASAPSEVGDRPPWARGLARTCRCGTLTVTRRCGRDRRPSRGEPPPRTRRRRDALAGHRARTS